MLFYGQKFSDWKKGGDFMGSLWLGALVGFLITLVLGWLFPGIGHLIGGLIGGFVAGIIARGGILTGALAGFLAGIFGGIIITLLAVVGLAVIGGVSGGIMGGAFRRLGWAGSWSNSDYPCYLWSDRVNDRRIHRRFAGKITTPIFFICLRKVVVRLINLQAAKS